MNERTVPLSAARRLPVIVLLLLVIAASLTLPETMGVGPFILDLYLIVYQWWDNVRIQSPTTDANSRLKLGTVTVKVW